MELNAIERPADAFQQGLTDREILAVFRRAFGADTEVLAATRAGRREVQHQLPHRPGRAAGARRAAGCTRPGPPVPLRTRADAQRVRLRTVARPDRTAHAACAGSGLVTRDDRTGLDDPVLPPRNSGPRTPRLLPPRDVPCVCILRMQSVVRGAFEQHPQGRPTLPLHPRAHSPACQLVQHVPVVRAPSTGTEQQPNQGNQYRRQHRHEIDIHWYSVCLIPWPSAPDCPLQGLGDEKVEPPSRCLGATTGCRGCRGPAPCPE